MRPVPAPFGHSARTPPAAGIPLPIFADIIHPSKHYRPGISLNGWIACASRRLLDHTQNRPPDVANVLDSTIPYTGWSSSRTPVAPAGRDRTLRPPPSPAYERPV
ncbi:hypothetical protein OH76DRAFT_1254538 [Lentinus brumalis]|uniref:Uncharacterized protein n=1 Tax=Lentinus brumalis TaxID=2498619 RepID=A0A371CRM7_9APHY|nr:hypothetical protein OH76DRAFT_1254538 [Polyporus brumalis]